ncbi:MAG: GNAT family N-acetyltransferase [Burkholderiaceae bacterium]|jgi:putative acetyltransferase|nr:GNAT family N-acetyltransferase [Burkholderiaceae bacterium]
MTITTTNDDSQTLMFRLDALLDDARVIALLEEHLSDMRSISPPESVHALDLAGLRQPEIRFWSAWSGTGADAQLVGTCALKLLDAGHAELKSMRVTAGRRGKGDGQRMLDHVLAYARQSGIRRISLETGTPDYFAPAWRLYERNGFAYCEPFGDYRQDPYSCFMTRAA